MAKTIKKKPRVIFISDAKFSASPKKLANKLNLLSTTRKHLVRLKSRPQLLPSLKRKLLTWGQNINKLQQYQAFKNNNLPHPEWTTDINEAEQWHKDGHTVLARTLLNSFGGKGIVIFDETSGFNRNIKSQVWTKYKKKKSEFRIHIFGNQIIDFAQKKKQKEANNNNNNVNHKIRNHKNGWVYCRENIEISPTINSLALSAINTLNLQYGAVDIIWNEKEQQAYILEVNTSPGLDGKTVDTYAQAFNTFLNN